MVGHDVRTIFFYFCIFVLSDQDGDLVGYMAFQEKKIICSPVYNVFQHVIVRAKPLCLTLKERSLKFSLSSFDDANRVF